MRTLNKTIKAEVERLGFSFLHITQPIQPPHYQAYLRWLTDSSAGEMGYLSTDKTRLSRGNPAGLLENARSMLTFGVRYSQLTQNPLTQQNPQRPVGLIASYALHNDYHGLLKQAAQRLMDLVKRETTCDVHYRVFVDSSALLEKDSAFMAGAGWIGKNSLLITPEGGSFQVLGCILTDLDLPAEPAFSKDLCGTCQKCQISCPTGCISAEHTLRADECIAYLTIEHKGVIPRGMRAKMGNWVFGCDVCQNVCPWNKKIPAVETAAPILPIWQSNPQIDLLQDPMGRAGIPDKIHGQRHPACHTCRLSTQFDHRHGNSASIACLPVLKEILTSNADGLLRLHAAWAIAALEPPNKRQILETALAAENDERVREELCIGLSQE
jgi:epoxyqueuosine reductase